MKKKANKKVKQAKVKHLTLKNSDLEMLMASTGLKNMRESKDLPVSFSFRLAILLDKLQSPIKAYSTEKQKLIEKYGDRDKEKKLIESLPGQFVFSTKAQWFQKEFLELLDLEIVFDGEKLEIAMDDIPKGIISANDIIALMSIVNIKEA